MKRELIINEEVVSYHVSNGISHSLDVCMLSR